jgi:ribosomal protein L12E/L44/L45/RPP1/RPP2
MSCCYIKKRYMREIQPLTAAIAVQVQGKTIATITNTMEGITIMTAAAAVRVQTAAALAVQAPAAGVGAAAADKVKKLV